MLEALAGSVRLSATIWDVMQAIILVHPTEGSNMSAKWRTELKDDYDHEDVQIEYVIENVIFDASEDVQQSAEYQNLTETFNSMILNACSCSGACDSSEACPYGGNYIPYPGELVLNPSRRSKDLMYECSAGCNCDPMVCQNRLVQHGPRLNLEIIASKLLHKQYALRTNAFIPRGAFVCEYAGEALTREEAIRRMAHRNVESGSGTENNTELNYVLCLNEYSSGAESTSSSALQTFIDPRVRGNIGRYLNHSCQPNCEIFSVRVDCPIPKIAIFAKRDIAAGEELCFHYGGGVNASISDANAIQDNQCTPCRCGSTDCGKFLPNLQF